MNNGRKLVLAVWRQSWGVDYPPSEASINFVDEVYDGSRWHCTYRKTDRGYTKWLQVEPI